MAIFDNGGSEWRQQADGSWVRWDGSRWVAGNQAPVPASQGMVGTNPTEDADKRGFPQVIDGNGQQWRWTGSAWVGSGPSSENETAPVPPPDWRTQQGWWGRLFPTDVTQRAAYSLDPSFAWATMNNKTGGNSWAPEYNWRASQQQRYYDQYADENTRAQNTPLGDLDFADYIEIHQPGFHRQFMQLPSSQKGYADYWQPAGRSTF